MHPRTRAIIRPHPSAIVGAIVGAIAISASTSIAAGSVPSSRVSAPPAVQEHLPRILARDIPLMDRILQLDANQRAIVDLLVDDIESAGGTRASIERFRVDLAAVLTDAQRARMPEVWAMLYRERMEAAGAIGGESVDVGAVARAVLRGESSEALDRAIAPYHAELDPLLDIRAATTEPAALLRVRLDVRSVNDRAVEALAATMSDDLAARLRRDARAKGFPTACAMSPALLSLEIVLRETPTDPLRELRSMAGARFDSLIERGVAAVRERDSAAASSPESQAVAARAIEAAEKDYDAFEPWLVKQVVAAAPAEVLEKSAAGRSLLEQSKANSAGADHPWHDPRETIKRFDTNGNGEIDGDESTAVLDAYARSVGKQSRRRL